MFNKNLFVHLLLQGLLFYILAVNLFAEEQPKNEVSNSSFVELNFSSSINDNSSLFINEYLNISLSKHDKASYKSPWVAFFLSYIIPGSGQIYNGEILKGLAFTGTFFLGAAIALIPAIGATSGSDWPTASYIGFGIAGVSYVWQLIDAPVSANRINEENNLSFYKLNILDDHEVSIGLSSEMGLKLNYRVPLF